MTFQTAIAECGPPSIPLDDSGDHRCTPRAIWQALLWAIHRDEFDLDTCTNDFATLPANTRYTGNPVDGLTAPWFGDAFTNPPFSDFTPWTRRWLGEREARSLTFLGTNDDSTEWHRAMVCGCDAWAAWRGREHFPKPSQPKGQPQYGTHLFFRGRDARVWVQRMRAQGCIAYYGHP